MAGLVMCMLAALAADPTPHTAAPDLSPVAAALQGEWVYHSGEGDTIPSNVTVYRLQYGPDRYSLDLRLPGQEVIEHRVYTFMLVPRTNPQAFVVWQERRTEPYVHGILRFADGKLERLYTPIDNPRPRSFDDKVWEHPNLLRTLHVRPSAVPIEPAN